MTAGPLWSTALGQMWALNEPSALCIVWAVLGIVLDAECPFVSPACRGDAVSAAALSAALGL